MSLRYLGASMYFISLWRMPERLFVTLSAITVIMGSRLLMYNNNGLFVIGMDIKLLIGSLDISIDYVRYYPMIPNPSEIVVIVFIIYGCEFFFFDRFFQIWVFVPAVSEDRQLIRVSKI